jgi:hypothetical protein
MILDRLNMLMDNVALGSSGISDVIDLGDDVVLHQIGGPDAIYLVIETGPVPATDVSSDATLRVQLASDSTANLATSPTIHYDTGVLTFAQVAVANKTLAVAPLPFGDYERYLGAIITVAAGPFTAGSLRVFLTRDPQYWRVMGSVNPSAK